MLQKFHKYHGTGNDFVIVDDTKEGIIEFTESDIATICHRRFGVGADGLIIIRKSEEADFYMVYYNSDGKEGTMCGNGGRCAVQFAHDIGLIGEQTTFKAIDGFHEADVIQKDQINLKMQPVSEIKETPFGLFTDTGSPHLVIEVDDLHQCDVAKEGERIRRDEYFMPNGVNVNFYKVIGNVIHLRTFERGVEAETLACGTGSIATAIIAAQKKQINEKPITVLTQGGPLIISFEKNEKYQNVWLKGQATKVFEGYNFIK
mgnify:CR=1 FL=1